MKTEEKEQIIFMKEWLPIEKYECDTCSSFLLLPP